MDRNRVSSRTSEIKEVQVMNIPTRSPPAIPRKRLSWKRRRKPTTGAKGNKMAYVKRDLSWVFNTYRV